MKKKLDGIYQVEEFSVDGEVKDVYTDFRIGILDIHTNDKVIQIPARREFFDSRDCKWNLDKREGEFYMTISKSEDELFNGEYKLTTDESDEPYFFIILESDRVYMKCLKDGW